MSNVEICGLILIVGSIITFMLLFVLNAAEPDPSITQKWQVVVLIIGVVVLATGIYLLLFS